MRARIVERSALFIQIFFHTSHKAAFRAVEHRGHGLRIVSEIVPRPDGFPSRSSGLRKLPISQSFPQYGPKRFTSAELRNFLFLSNVRMMVGYIAGPHTGALDGAEEKI